jgi:hypothetical protein
MAINIYAIQISDMVQCKKHSMCTKIFYMIYMLTVYHMCQVNVLMSATTLLVIVGVMMYFHAEHAYESGPQSRSARVPQLIINKFNSPVTCLTWFLTLVAL